MEALSQGSRSWVFFGSRDSVSGNQEHCPGVCVVFARDGVMVTIAVTDDVTGLLVLNACMLAALLVVLIKMRSSAIARFADRCAAGLLRARHTTQNQGAYGKERWR